jgi:hypothetical protein
VKHEHQVPLDAITQAMHLDSLLVSINDGDEWEGFGKAHKVAMSMQMAKRVSLTGHGA